MPFGKDKKDDKDKLAVLGKVDHYKVTKKGGWSHKESSDTHTFTGYSNEPVGRVTITVVVDRKTGAIKKATAKDGRGNDAEVSGGTIRIGGAVVLNAVNAKGQTMTRKAIIYNEFNV